MDELYGNGAFPDSRGTALDRTMSNISGDEDAWHA